MFNQRRKLSNGKAVTTLNIECNKLFKYESGRENVSPLFSIIICVKEHMFHILKLDIIFMTCHHFKYVLLTKNIWLWNRF